LTSGVPDPGFVIDVIDSSCMSLVLDRVIKVDTVKIIDNRNKAACTALQDMLVTLSDELANLPPNELKDEEVEWRARMKAVEFRIVLAERNGLWERLGKMTCLDCEHFDEHVSFLGRYQLK
jgi:hypothetical protein